jgi:hypothetical protein
MKTLQILGDVWVAAALPIFQPEYVSRPEVLGRSLGAKVEPFVFPRGCNRNSPFLLVRRSQIAVGCGPYICGLPCPLSLRTGKTLQVAPAA